MMWGGGGVMEDPSIPPLLFMCFVCAGHVHLNAPQDPSPAGAATMLRVFSTAVGRPSRFLPDSPGGPNVPPWRSTSAPAPPAARDGGAEAETGSDVDSGSSQESAEAQSLVFLTAARRDRKCDRSDSV